MTPGPIQRKKAKHPLLGGVCLLTTEDLISVGQGFVDHAGYVCPTPENVKSAEMGAPHGPERLGRAGRECRGEVYPCWTSGTEPNTCQYRVDHMIF